MKALRIHELLEGLGLDALAELLQAWTGRPISPPAEPARNPVWRRWAEGRLARLMQRETLLDRKVRALHSKLAALFDRFLEAPGHALTEEELCAKLPPPLRSVLDAQTCLAALEREGLLFAPGGPSALWAVPLEIARLALWARRRLELGLEHPLTLLSHLERIHFLRREEGPGDAQARRGAYRVLAGREAVLRRLARLPDPLLRIVEHALAEHGGLLPRHLYERCPELPPWNGPAMRRDLEQAALGTVHRLSLVRFGVDLEEETVLLFLETSLAWLRGRRLPEPPLEAESLLAADLATNLGRLIELARGGGLRLTRQGRPHRWAEKRLREELLPMGGGSVPPEEAVRFLMRYAASRGLLAESEGRWLPAPEAGDALRRSLDEVLLDLLRFAIRDTTFLGENFHQVGMRRRVMRFLRRLKAGEWLYPLDLPFLARNTYLSGLNSLTAEEFFANRMRRTLIGALETPRQMAASLRDWIVRRLHLLGLVDLGFRDGALAGIALSIKGAALLGELPSLVAAGATSTLVVNPDFELLLFPGADGEEAVHYLDRFARRTVSDRVYHFRLGEEELRRGLQSGLELAEVLAWLEERARAPLPRNVLWTMKEWGDRAGVIRLQEGFLLRARTPEMVESLLARPDLAAFVLDRPCPRSVIMDAGLGRTQLRRVLRELGFLVDPGPGSR